MSQTTGFHLVQDGRMSGETGTTRIPQGRDRAAKRLFGHPQVVADLLRGFVSEGPLQGFDPDDLHRGPDDRVDEKLALYQSDVTWTLRLADGARVVLIIESQSTVDRAMAARMTIQTGMYCENHLRPKRSGRIPAVLPLVYYTGRAPWSAARSLVEPSFAERAGLLTYFAASCYLLIDVRRMPPESLPGRNLVSLMVRIGSAEDSGELLAAMRLDEEWLGEEDPGLWGDFLTLAVKVLAPLEFPEMDVGKLQTLREGVEMINEGVVRELEEKRQSGLAEGQRSLLRHLIVGKFGDEIAERCAEQLSGFGGNGRMEELGDLILDCRTGEEFLKKL